MATVNTPPDNISQSVERVAAFRFVENGAGTYTGSVTLPARAILTDVQVHAEVLWTAASSALLKVGDVTDDDGILVDVDLKATDLILGESISVYQAGGQQGADLGDAATPGTQWNRRRLTTARVVSATVVSVGAGTAGRTVVSIHYVVPVEVEVTQ